jgi:hypothetical protein
MPIAIGGSLAKNAGNGLCLNFRLPCRIHTM